LSIVDERWAVGTLRRSDAPAVPLPADDLTALDRDTQRALRAAARNLTKEFAGTFDTETIEGFLVSRYAELARDARITKFLPLLSESFVRDRLRVLATRTSAG
jgi:arsenate reductase (thioredoxin)